MIEAVLDNILDETLAGLIKMTCLFPDETVDRFIASIKFDILAPMQNNILKLQEHNQKFIIQSASIRIILETADSINLLENLD